MRITVNSPASVSHSAITACGNFIINYEECPDACCMDANNGLSIDGTSPRNVQLGQDASVANCSVHTNQLTTNREVQMNGHQLHFSNSGSDSPAQGSKIGIGTSICDVDPSLRGKLEVNVESSDNAGVALYIEQSQTSGKGIYTDVNGIGGSGSANIAHQITVSGAQHNDGMIISAVGGNATGLTATAKNGTGNIGIQALAEGSSATNAGLVANAKGGTINRSIYAYLDAGYGPNDYAAFFAGPVYTTADYYKPSDERFKSNIKPIENSLEKLQKLGGYTYDYKVDEFKDRAFDSGNSLGVLGQEVQKVFPQLIRESEGFLAVNYLGLIPVLISAANEQQKIVEELKQEVAQKDKENKELNERLSKLENCLSALLPTLCELNQEAIQSTSDEEQNRIKEELKNTIQVNLTNRNTVLLSQNVPNPFAEQTTISYVVPVNVKVAQIQFFDSKGAIIHTVDISERGAGELKVFASDLSSGMYSYSLVTDGKVVAHKKMMKQ